MSTSSTAKTRSRPNSEFVLYSYGEPVAMANDSGTSYFGTDILGSVRSVTDKYGTVQADYSYDAFGSPYLGNLENDIGFGYCGKVYDVGTGLYDYGFRDYNPVSARFTTIDPIRDGANWFSYVVNDPVNYCDPFGLESLKEKAKRTLVADDWILINDTDVIAVAYPEGVNPKEFLNEDNSINEDKYAAYISKMIIYPGEESEFIVDGGSLPGKKNIDNPNKWTYIGVTDGNSVRFSGNKTIGYKVSVKNTTYGNSFGNTISKLHKQKGPYKGLKYMSIFNPEMRNWLPEEGKSPKDIRQMVYNDANTLASALNRQLQNSTPSLNMNFSFPSSNVTSSILSYTNFNSSIYGDSAVMPSLNFAETLDSFVKAAKNDYLSGGIFNIRIGCTK